MFSEPQWYFDLRLNIPESTLNSCVPDRFLVLKSTAISVLSYMLGIKVKEKEEQCKEECEFAATTTITEIQCEQI